MPAVVLLAVLLGLPAACRFPGSIRPTVKIGLVAPFEGRYRYVGYDVIYAVRLALREVNEAGEIAGRGVELAAFDDGGDPALAPAQARKLALDPEVLGAMGHYRLDTTRAAARDYAAAGLPLIGVSGLRAGLEPLGDEDGFLFTVGPDPERVGRALVTRASELAPDRQVVLASDASSGPLAEAVKVAAGEQGLGLTAVDAGREGWQQDVLGYYPEVLVCDLDPVAAGEVVALLGEGGWRGDVLGGPALSAADFRAVAGDRAAGVVFVTPWPFPIDVAGGEEFADAYRAVSNGLEPGPLALPAYEAAHLLLDAVEAAVEKGDPTRDGVRAALAELQNGGRLAVLDAGGSGAAVQAGLYWYRIAEDGAPTLLCREAASGIEPQALE